MNHKDFSKEDWSCLIYGLRKKLNLSQPELSQKFNLKRWTIIRWENKIQKPRKSSIKKVLNFIEDSKLNSNELIRLGKECTHGFSKDKVKPKLNLDYSEELAELIGIILGDGEIHSDGIRISFDPKKDEDFLCRKVIPIIKKLLKSKIKYESYKRIVVYNRSFLRFLKEDCNFDQGSKSRSHISIPNWCFSKREYTSAVLRGLFDTDGYFGYCGGSVELMYGRFTDKCTSLVLDIEKAMKLLELSPVTKHTNDGRYKIRLLNKKEVINFFNTVGTSNLKHIVRFLLWRLAGYEAKIESEGLSSLIRKCNSLMPGEVASFKLPYYWNNDIISEHPTFILQDELFIKTHIKKTKNI